MEDTCEEVFARGPGEITDITGQISVSLDHLSEAISTLARNLEPILVVSSREDKDKTQKVSNPVQSPLGLQLLVLLKKTNDMIEHTIYTINDLRL